MDYNTLTINDCIKMHEQEHKALILHNGQVIAVADEAE